MTLTEQWNKGKLPEGDYYIKRRNGDTLYDNIDSRGVWRNSIDEDIIEVLAEVPSYEEWQQLKKWCEEFNALEVAKENTKLKDLLKEIRGKLHYINTPVNQHNIFSNDFIKRLDQVLGEDK